MIIDFKQLDFVVAKSVELLTEHGDEWFFKIPKIDNYLFSNYGRLLKLTEDTKTRTVCEQIVLKNKGESFDLLVNGELKTIPIRKLFSMVFLHGMNNAYIYNTVFNPNDPYRWHIDNLCVLTSQDEITETIKAKTEHRELSFDLKKKKINLINQPMFEELYRKALRNLYNSMLQRVAINPDYVDTTICDEWKENENSFYYWYIRNLYDYPEKLFLDKDIRGLLYTENSYSPKTCCLVPRSLNRVFSKNYSKLGYCITERIKKDGTKSYSIQAGAYSLNPRKEKTFCTDSYVEALQFGRRKRAKYLRDIVAEYRSEGLIPDDILAAILSCANLCEIGSIKSWEPSNEVIRERMI